MMNKKASVAKWVALAVVPLSLSGVLANVALRHREERAKSATQQLLRGWSSDVVEEWSVEELLQQGADVRARDKQGRTALLLAAFSKPSAIETLLDYGADIDAQDGFGTTPLIGAVSSGNANGVRLLLRRGANINAQRTIYRTAQSALSVAQESLEAITSNPNWFASARQGRIEIARYREIIHMLKAAGARE